MRGIVERGSRPDGSRPLRVSSGAMGDLAGRWRELNKAYWDERVPIHLGSAFYDAEGFRARPDSLKEFETAEVGDVRVKILIHLQ